MKKKKKISRARGEMSYKCFCFVPPPPSYSSSEKRKKYYDDGGREQFRRSAAGRSILCPSLGCALSPHTSLKPIKTL